jgi:hypothetical protein
MAISAVTGTLAAVVFWWLRRPDKDAAGIKATASLTMKETRSGQDALAAFRNGPGGPIAGFDVMLLIGLISAPADSSSGG